MGKKGDKLTKDSNIRMEILLDELMSIEGITSKRMFGGNGIFHEGKMFGMVNSKAECLFKVNDSNRKDYEDKGGVKHVKMPYYSIPEEVLENRDLLVKWALKSIEISK